MPWCASPPASQRLPVEKSVEVGQLTCLAIHFWRLYQTPRCVKAKNLESLPRVAGGDGALRLRAGGPADDAATEVGRRVPLPDLLLSVDEVGLWMASSGLGAPPYTFTVLLTVTLPVVSPGICCCCADDGEFPDNALLR